MKGNINNVYDRNFTYMSKNVRNGENSKSGKINEVTKGAPYKVEKLRKMANLAKFAMGLENI